MILHFDSIVELVEIETGIVDMLIHDRDGPLTVFANNDAFDELILDLRILVVDARFITF